jgi:hypothetical protein
MVAQRQGSVKEKRIRGRECCANYPALSAFSDLRLFLQCGAGFRHFLLFFRIEARESAME